MSDHYLSIHKQHEIKYSIKFNILFLEENIPLN